MNDRVLTVIPCLDEMRHLPRLVHQLLRDPTNQCIVVADGGSRDGSREWVRELAQREPRLVLLDNVRRIQGAGVNEAVRIFGTSRRWLARIDAHARYPEHYVSRLLGSARRHEAQSVVVPMHTVGGKGFQQAVACAQNSRLGTGGSPHRRSGTGGVVDHGHHALMRLDVFRSAGGYRERMATNEDAELDVRLVASGARIWLEPGCTIDYFPRRTIAALARQYFRYGRGRAVTVGIHRLPLKWRQRVPLLVAPALLVAALAVARVLQDPASVLLAAPALFWMATCLTFGLLLAIKAQRYSLLLSGIALMTMHASWSAGYWLEKLTSRDRKRVQVEIDALGSEPYSSRVAKPME